MPTVRLASRVLRFLASQLGMPDPSPATEVFIEDGNGLWGLGNRV
jgi:hypothetical protein